ncbi:MAG: hypothetical protein R3F65_32220 [bacterium]
MTTHVDPPGLLEMETLPQTANYRAERQQLWTTLRQKYEEYVARAQQHGASEAAAQEAAARSFRGEVNLFVGELLTHARKDDVAAFVLAAPREWGARGELLLADPAVPGLIGRSFPVGAWVDRYDEISRKVASDDAQWGAWLGKRLDQLGQAGAAAADRAFGVVEAVSKGVGDGVGAIGRDRASGDARRRGAEPRGGGRRLGGVPAAGQGVRIMASEAEEGRGEDRGAEDDGAGADDAEHRDDAGAGDGRSARARWRGDLRALHRWRRSRCSRASGGESLRRTEAGPAAAKDPAPGRPRSRPGGSVAGFRADVARG